MALIKQERVLQAFWSLENESQLKENVSEIGLAARPKSQDTGYLLLQYTFQNSAQCEAELKELEKSVF